MRGCPRAAGAAGRRTLGPGDRSGRRPGSGGRPLLPAAEVPSLAPRGGAFRRSWRGFLPAWLAGRVREEEVRAEWRAQIARAVEAGVRPSHLDSHQHLHALPRLFTIARDLAGEFGVPRIRSLREPGPGLAGTPLRRKLILRGLSRLSAAAAGDSGVSCDRIFGVAEAGRLDLPALLSVLRRVPEGRTELVTHPGLLDPELSREYRWDYRWEEELRALCSTEVAAEVARLGITLDRAS